MSSQIFGCIFLQLPPHGFFLSSQTDEELWRSLRLVSSYKNLISPNRHGLLVEFCMFSPPLFLPELADCTALTTETALLGKGLKTAL